MSINYSALGAIGAVTFLILQPLAEANPQPEYDVRSFGATCNGSTDDSRALQTALDAVPPSGGTVLIPCKLAVGATGVRLVNKSSVVVRGTVPGAGLKAIGRGTQGVQGFGPIMFVIQYCTDCRIQDLHLDANWVSVGLLGFDRCTRTVAENNVMINVGNHVIGAALSAVGNKDNRYLRNTVERTVHGSVHDPRGMWIGNANPSEYEWRPTISGNTIRESSGTGIATHAIGPTISGNTVEGVIQGAGIKLAPPPGIPGHTLVENNTLRRNQFHGIQVERGFDIMIRANLIEENDMSAIFALNGFTNSSITNNVVRDNNFDKQGGWQGGIYIHHASNAVIEGNQIYERRSGGNRSQDNAIILNATSPGAIRQVQIRNNICRNHLEHGISIQNNGSGTLSDITVTGNTCTENTRYGLEVDEKSPGAIRNVSHGNNTFNPNGAGTIYDDSVQGITIAPEAPDTSPSVAIMSPLNGATISGVVTVSANASDNSGVAGVQFKLDGANLGSEDTSAPYSTPLDTRQIADGNYTITAIARDVTNKTTQSGAVAVRVSNTVPPPTTPGGSATAFITQYSPGTLVTGGYSGWTGARLRTGPTPLTITELGRLKLQNNSATHTLKLVHAATGQDVSGASTEISMANGAPSQFIYGALQTPILLQPNTLYYLVSSESVHLNRGDFFHDYNGHFTTTGAAQLEGGVFRGGTAWQYIGGSNQGVGPVNFKYLVP